MIAATVTIVLPALISTALTAQVLRRLVRDEVDVEHRLRAPDLQPLSCSLPKGVDPGEFRGLL